MQIDLHGNLVHIEYILACGAYFVGSSAQSLVGWWKNIWRLHSHNKLKLFLLHTFCFDLSCASKLFH